MNGQKVKVALVGGGSIAPTHGECLRLSPTCELVSIIDPFAPGQNLAAKYGVPHFESVGALLSSGSPHPDTYIICVPSGLHVSIARDVILLASPKAILVEKPLATDSISAGELLKLANEKGCKILTGHHRRFHPALAATQNAITSGQLGTITAISSQWTTKKNDSYYQVSKWRTSRELGGGPIWSNFVHEIDVLHYLMGSRVTRVWAIQTPNRRFHWNVDPEDQVEEGAAIMLQFANGAVGTFIISDNVASPYSWESASGENPSFAQAPMPIDTIRIFGTDGSVTTPDCGLWKYQKEEALKKGVELGWYVPMKRKLLEVADGIPYQYQIEHLARVVKGEEEPRCSGEDGLAAVRVCEAVLKALSDKDGLPVSIPVGTDPSCKL